MFPTRYLLLSHSLTPPMAAVNRLSQLTSWNRSDRLARVILHESVGEFLEKRMAIPTWSTTPSPPFPRPSVYCLSLHFISPPPTPVMRAIILFLFSYSLLIFLSFVAGEATL